MTNKEILQAAEDNAMNYCMHRAVAKGAFVEGALWAMREFRKKLVDILNADSHEDEV